MTANQMTNHPSRRRGPYTAEIGGSFWSQGPKGEFATMRECRQFAESFGTTADHCAIYDAKGRLIASHRRDRNGDGTIWFRAAI
jgi:hypothetical protein